MYEKDSQNMTSLKNTNQVSPTLLYVEIISFHIENWGVRRRRRPSSPYYIHLDAIEKKE